MLQPRWCLWPRADAIPPLGCFARFLLTLGWPLFCRCPWRFPVSESLDWFPIPPFVSGRRIFTPWLTYSYHPYHPCITWPFFFFSFLLFLGEVNSTYVRCNGILSCQYRRFAFLYKECGYLFLIYLAGNAFCARLVRLTRWYLFPYFIYGVIIHDQLGIEELRSLKYILGWTGFPFARLLLLRLLSMSRQTCIWCSVSGYLMR